jgi:hypothetical protein
LPSGKEASLELTCQTLDSLQACQKTKGLCQQNSKRHAQFIVFGGFRDGHSVLHEIIQKSSLYQFLHELQALWEKVNYGRPAEFEAAAAVIISIVNGKKLLGMRRSG